jgi:hypothetical protein
MRNDPYQRGTKTTGLNSTLHKPVQIVVGEETPLHGILQDTQPERKLAANKLMSTRQQWLRETRPCEPLFYEDFACHLHD